MLTVVVSIGQILSAGGMARLLRFSWIESLAVGVGMCGRAEMAYVLTALGLQLEVFGPQVFSVLIFTTFALNTLAAIGLKGCAITLNRPADKSGRHQV